MLKPKRGDPFKALYEKIHSFPVIHGSCMDYSPQEIIRIIERVRHSHNPLQRVTRAEYLFSGEGGLRSVVAKLLETDPVYHKYTRGSRAKKGLAPKNRKNAEATC